MERGEYGGETDALFSHESIAEETGYELYEQADPGILEGGQRAETFFTMLGELRMVHGEHNVVTSFFPDERGLLWFGIFIRPADRSLGFPPAAG